MKDYTEFYSRLTAPLRERPWMIKILRVSNWILTKLMAVLYPLLLLDLLGREQFYDLGLTIFIPGLAFTGLSYFRMRLNLPRPYETWAISPLIDKASKGNSLPSRHVFSAAMISLCLYQISPRISVLCLVFSAILALCRVLGGVHYPRDVILGYFTGVLAGLLLLIFL
ncbi:phosphatase PAP2 family protein [Streptococcus tangpeifui]|uniref:phosphatase PAP2 family protein n=1 Tax=Streptococcus tangpeifui TaxID=2709400 RepID=UPI0013EBBCFE